ncbi:MAG: hypothetical protein NC247_12400 [Ruminococcus flavefaciens]|nr:hypothetical protein [Ruminococcus flavefaciens]MCM1363179.1 hypothetical protein [Clostridiales bacterium]MCM1436223.1 hypothetical protein [Ruminococcus flavefaciens]
MRTPAPTNNTLFDRFWKAYPRKEGKPKALRTFEKLKLTDETLEQVLAELERQSKLKDWKNINVKYIPLAQTWLNRRDWEEDQNGTDRRSDIGNSEDQYGSFVY